MDGKRVINALIRLLFPPKCMFCHAVLDDGCMCKECRSKLAYCSGKMTDGSFYSSCASAVYYKDAARSAALKMKFSGKSAYANGFGELLTEAVKREYAGEYDVITWVPLSLRHLKKRGYDQAELIACHAAELLGEPAEPLLKKVRDTKTQSTLKEKERRTANVSGAYEVTNKADVVGKRVLLIDDIVTTGATLSECARMLLMAGAEDVVAATALSAKRKK
jgi:ComF family protein